MAKDFLGKLGDTLNAVADGINSSLSVGESNDTSLKDKLGDYYSRVDRTEERKYLEEGYLRTDPFNAKSKQYEILMQQPTATLLIKKRMFSSVAENYKIEFMDTEEKLFFRSMKLLFQNKCRQISALEGLSKVQKITENSGDISKEMTALAIGIVDGSQGTLFGGLSSPETKDFEDTISKLRKILFLNESSKLTTWITDNSNIFSTQFGSGTGVIEITNFSSFNTTNVLTLSGGRASFNVEDPYKAMVINEYDIEKALSDATNVYKNSQFLQFGRESAEELVKNSQSQLNKLRADRSVGNITFHVSKDTSFGRKVTATIDNAGIEIPFEYDPGFGGVNNLLSSPKKVVIVSPEYLSGGAAAGNSGLSSDVNKIFPIGNETTQVFKRESELSLFRTIVQNIYNNIQIDNNSEGDVVASNEVTNYARRKLRSNFLGRNIIQPMDSIHFYISSKSRFDSRLMTGVNTMFTGSGVLENLNKTVSDFKSSLNSVSAMFGGSGGVDYEAEKAMFVGPDFPSWLWSSVRSQFLNEKEGTHVFAGLVSGSESSFSDGKYTVSVNSEDNSAYFKKGKINFKPGVDVFNGSLFDPLTPFKTKSDTVSSNVKGEQLELLDENIQLLGGSNENNSLAKHKAGPSAGKVATQDNLLQERKINKETQLLTRTYYMPDGLVYKWKEGIGGIAYTRESLNPNNVETTGHPAITKDPFAGQDVMNVLSLLVTGVPYNFNTYWRSVMEFDNSVGDSSSNESAANSYYSSLREGLSKQNVLWGNFIPFKTLTIDEQSYKNMLTGLIGANKTNKEIDGLLHKVKDLQRIAQYTGAGAELQGTINNTDPNSGATKDKYSAELTKINNQITSLVKEARDKSQSDYAVDFINTDVTENPGFIDNSDGQISDLSRKKLRRKINNLTRRMSYNVRANEDKNLFIVDDFYDKDYDLMAFTKDLENGMELYKNEFTNVFEKIEKAAEVMQLETFCDSQGHFRVRPPQYNRVPSSVFYKMIEDKRSKGVQIFPQFLDDLFSNQINTLSERLEVVEDEIRLMCAVTGLNDDIGCQNFINKNSKEARGKFQFLSVEGEVTEFELLDKEDSNVNTSTFKNIGQSLLNAVGYSDDEISDNDVFLNLLQEQSRTNRAQYSIHQRAQSALSAITDHQLSENGYKLDKDFTQNFVNNSYIDSLITRIELKTARKVNKYEYIIKNTLDGSIDVTPTNELDFLKLLDDLSKKTRERQKVIKLLAGAVKSAQEFKSLDDQPAQTRNKLLMPGIYGNEEVPEVLEHMIEDEKYDDYGVDSGSRYIIKDSQIIRYNISEHPPDYTYVQVRGVQNPYGESLPTGFNPFPGNGNGLVTADAIDYDTWRAYGFTAPSTVTMPSFNNPQTQCLPYAAMLLSQARKNILRGSVTIIGNEFMQQGEVIYLESSAMLFYVDSVQHSFTYGGEFQTTLQLSYGHAPGEYIPVPLDVIGKMLYNNRDQSTFVIQRQNSVFNEESLGIVIRDPKIETPNDLSEYEDQESTYSSSNSKTIANTLLTGSKVLGNNGTIGNNVNAIIELRVFYDSNNPVDQDMWEFAQSIKNSLTGGDMSVGASIGTTTAKKEHTLDVDSVKVVEVSINSVDDYKASSQKAYSAARNLAENNEEPLTTIGNETQQEAYTRANRLKRALFTNIVDCVICFNEVTKEEANPIG